MLEKTALPHPAVLPFRPSLLPFQWGDIKGRIITLDASCQFSLNLFISFRVSLEGYAHGKCRLLSSHRRRKRDRWQGRQCSSTELFFYCNKRGGDNGLPNPDNCNPVTARCQVICGFFFFSFFFFFFFSSPVDALPLIQLLLVLQALNSKLGCSQKKKEKKASYTFTDNVIYRGVAVEGNGHRSCLPPPRTAWCRDPPKTHILHGSGCAY